LTPDGVVALSFSPGCTPSGTVIWNVSSSSVALGGSALGGAAERGGAAALDAGSAAADEGCGCDVTGASFEAALTCVRACVHGCEWRGGAQRRGVSPEGRWADAADGTGGGWGRAARANQEARQQRLPSPAPVAARGLAKAPARCVRLSGGANNAATPLLRPPRRPARFRSSIAA